MSGDDPSSNTTSNSSSSMKSESESNESSNKESSDGAPPQKLRVRRRKLSELAPWEIWRCVRCGKCYSKTSKAAILEHVRVLCQAGVHDDEEIRRQMAMYARKQGGWIYSGKKMGLANTYNMNNYTLAPFHPPFGGGFAQPAVPFGYFPGAPAPATAVNRSNFQQGPLLSSAINEPSNKRAKYDTATLAVSAVKGSARSLSSESSSSSGGTSPGSRLSPINHSSQESSRPTSNDGNTESINANNSSYASYSMNEFNYGGGVNDIYQNGYGSNYGAMNYGYMNYPFAQQNFTAAPVAAAAARRPTVVTNANEISYAVNVNYPNGYNNNFVPRSSPPANARY